ncbi:unnamed protein product [Penicillium pancosmium]
MDPLSYAASVVAIIQLAGSIVKICGGYIKEAQDAREEILELQQAVTDLAGVLRQLHVLLQGPGGSRFSSSQTLDGAMTKCRLTLQGLEVIIGPEKRSNLMRRLGLRALAWPLKRSEVKGAISDLESYKSTFTLSLQIDQTTIITGISEITDRIHRNIDLKQLPVANGAEFDSYTNQYEDYCLPGTRTNLLCQVTKWARSPHGKCVFWLNGRAGTGKSTIARTVTDTLKKANLLGASFFFKRGEGDRGNATKLFPTITIQLAKSIPQLIPGIQKAIRDDSDIATKGLKEQFNAILLQPLLGLGPSAISIPIVVIVIDALDECDVDNDMRLVLQLLPRLRESKVVRLRVFLTSRPEWSIFEEFSKITSREYEDLILHQIPELEVKHDISLFLEHRLSAIRTDRSLPVDWPGNTGLKDLVELSAPLFIFAATICRIFEDPQWDPVDSLKEILTHRADGSKLDGTYLPVLNRLLDRQGEKQKKQLIHEYQQVIGTIVMLERPLSILSLSRFIDIPERVLCLRLNQLHSVLSVPDDKELVVRLFHLSFREFLLDLETRKKSPFWIDKTEMHNRLTIQCLLACHNLSKNICQLLSDGTPRAEIDQRTIDYHLSPELQYACQYWAHHLMQCTDMHAVMNDAFLFLQKHFLHWVEAMSLLGLASEVVGIINRLETFILGDNHAAMSEFLHDAKRFILKNWQIADEAPLQLYCSGLMFAPQKSIIRREFKSSLPTWISHLPQVEESWSAELQTLEAHQDSIFSVTFSPDGRLLASGSNDCTARLWDTATGALQQTLKGHSGSVWSLAFTPDGRQLASGSKDHIVRLWDTVTGALQQTLEGHLGTVYSVAVSPDGRLLASGSHDQTIRLWERATGAPIRILEGHLDLVRSVAFSYNGRLLASSSHDQTIRLWDTATGALQQTLEGHSYSVQSVAFSPNGKVLVSGSHDKTVRLWDTATGVLRQTLKGHSGSVWSVAFSPDGRLLASGSHDKTVRLWDTTTGALQQTLEGHSSTIYSVAFSPDGRLLASSSDDQTVRLWDTKMGALQRPLEAHSSAVKLMAFSRDGRVLVSGSDNKTVCLWDAASGDLQQTWKCHLELLFSVAFSRNGQLLGTEFNDQTIHIRDTVIGGLQKTLEGHSHAAKGVVFLHDGRLLVSGSADQTVRLWDAVRGALQQTCYGHLDLVFSAAFSHRRLLASGCNDHDFRLWDTATDNLRHTFEGHSHSVRSVAFSPDGRLLAFDNNDSTVWLWDTATGALKQTFEGHSSAVQSVAFSPNGRLLASGSRDKSVRLWCIVTGTLQHILRGYSSSICDIGTVWSVAFTPDGQLLASGSDDYKVRLWDTATGAQQQTLKGHSSAVQTVVFSPDGQSLASGSYDQTVRLWDTVTGALQHILEGHSYSVRSVAFSPDGRLLASGSNDRTVLLWDTATGTLQKTLAGHSGSIWSVAFSPDGRLLASGSHDMAVLLWDTATGAWLQTLEGHSGAVQSVAFSPNGLLLASGSYDKSVRLWDIATNLLHKTLSIDEMVTVPVFSQGNSCLSTNFGSIDVQSNCGLYTLNSSQLALDSIIQREQWIVLDGEKLLWLPSEARPSCYAMKDNKLALGHKSGRVSFIGFRV